MTSSSMRLSRGISAQTELWLPPREAQETRKKGDRAMTNVGTRDIPLKWDVFVTPGIPVVTSDLPPGAKQRMWSPTSSTLISGKRDAVLVDTFITVEQTGAL